MLKVEHEFSNEGIRAAEHQLREYLGFANAQMAGEVPNPEGDAALGYVIIRGLADKLAGEIAAQNVRLSRPALAPRAKSVREERVGA